MYALTITLSKNFFMPNEAKKLDLRAQTAVAVDQYDALGKLVKSYSSITRAAKANGLTANQIMRALRPVTENGRYSTGGYFWRKKGQVLPPVSEIPNRGAKRRQVTLTKEGGKPKVFASQSHAARFLGVPPAFVCQALKRAGICREYRVSQAG